MFRGLSHFIFKAGHSVNCRENPHFPQVNVSDSRVYAFDCQHGHISRRSFHSHSLLCVWVSAARLSTLTNWPTVPPFGEGEVGAEHVMDRGGNHCNSYGEAGLLLRC